MTLFSLSTLFDTLYSFSSSLLLDPSKISYVLFATNTLVFRHTRKQTDSGQTKRALFTPNERNRVESDDDDDDEHISTPSSHSSLVNTQSMSPTTTTTTTGKTRVTKRIKGDAVVVVVVEKKNTQRSPTIRTSIPAATSTTNRTMSVEPNIRGVTTRYGRVVKQANPYPGMVSSERVRRRWVIDLTAAD